MADLSYLYNVSTNQNIVAADHNTLVQAANDINAEQLTTLNGLSAASELMAIGNLATMAGLIVGRRYVPSAITITRIEAVCPETPASGTIQLDLLVQTTPGGAITSLYTSRTKPTITCNGGYAFVVQSGATLPETVALAAGSALIVRVVSAAAGSSDLAIKIT